LLLVSDDSELQSRVKTVASKLDLAVSTEPKYEKLVDLCDTAPCDMLLFSAPAEISLPKDIIDTVRTIADKNPAVRVLLLLGKKHASRVLKAMRSRSFHYARLPVSDEELKHIVATSLDEQPNISDTKATDRSKTRVRFGNLIGKSNSMQRVYEQIEQAAEVDIPVLLLGETGTGKDLVGKLIHSCSDRESKPFVPVNLGSLPIELVASELFGHEKGAFTGASDSRSGVFEQANNGTVFLDEIDAIDNKVQVSLLRLLEDKRFNRLGGKQPIASHARLIAASNADLTDQVKNGTFRKDLFYRLDVLRIDLPALRQRQGDIPLLIEAMIAQYNEKFHKKINSVASDAVDLLKRYDWPGNVRELKNVIQRAVLICEDKELKPKHLPPRFRSKKKNRHDVVTFEIGTSLEDIEREMVIRTLEATDNNRKEAAKLLGISRRAIYSKLHKFNIE
jgi:DNA-binding NtrC family response regulator